MNNVSLVGRLTRDPEIKVSASGSSYARFAIAVDRRKKDDGADFINIIAFGKTSELSKSISARVTASELTDGFRQAAMTGKTARRFIHSMSSRIMSNSLRAKAHPATPALHPQTLTGS